MHHPIDRITHITDFVTPVVDHWLEREIQLKEGIVNVVLCSFIVTSIERTIVFIFYLMVYTVPFNFLTLIVILASEIIIY